METVTTLLIGGVVGLAIIMYVILDGFDLGIGILYPWVEKEENRKTMIATILPVWDGNETWLVLGGAALYGGFPEAYSKLLPTLYLPVIMMLAALIFRGVSFEFMHNAKKTKFVWTFFFSAGSLLAAFCQGVALGTFVQGYNFENGQMVVPDYVWLTPFSFLTGIAVIFGYALLGATWLIAKTEGELQSAMYHRARNLLIFMGLFMVVASLWTPFIDPTVTERWFGFPHCIFLIPLPLITMWVFYKNWQSLNDRQHDNRPFILSITIFLLAYVGFAISSWPYIIPRGVTVWEAAAPFKAQAFILVGMAILLPILIGYTIYAYVVFRGKVKPEGVSY